MMSAKTKARTYGRWDPADLPRLTDDERYARVHARLGEVQAELAEKRATHSALASRLYALRHGTAEEERRDPVAEAMDGAEPAPSEVERLREEAYEIWPKITRLEESERILDAELYRLRAQDASAAVLKGVEPQYRELLRAARDAVTDALPALADLRDFELALEANGLNLNRLRPVPPHFNPDALANFAKRAGERLNGDGK